MLLCELRQLVSNGYSHFAFINAGFTVYLCSSQTNYASLPLNFAILPKAYSASYNSPAATKKRGDSGTHKRHIILIIFHM